MDREDSTKIILYIAAAVALYYVFFSGTQGPAYEFFEEAQHPQDHHHHHHHDPIPQAAGTQEIYARAFPS